jgi:RHS repeat-associated protein
VLASSQARVFRQGFSWDALGNLESLTYPNCLHAACAGPDMPERVVTNVYDEGSLTGVSGYASSITYHPNGLLNRVTHANGMVDTQEVDTSGMARPRRITATGAQGTWASGLYTYDGSGNIASIGGDAFVYDALNRLTSATLGSSASGAVQGYAFDDYGNITSIVTGGSTRSLNVDARTNRLTASNYDSAGNQLSSGSGNTLQQYQFDALNRLSTHQNTSDARGFVYTVGGERFVEFDFAADPWEEVWTIRDLAGRVLRQWTHAGGSWNWSKDYIYRGSRLLASEDYDGAKHFHLDHLGTPRLITDGSEVVGEHAYFPFGEEVTSPVQNAERMKFTGHERDLGGAGLEDDLDYMHARYCSPLAGRFLSVDPEGRGSKPGLPQSWNRYAYAKNNPILLIDPDGEAADLAIDLGFIAYDVGDIITTLVAGDRVSKAQI